jgi:hypothetical protein
MKTMKATAAVFFLALAIGIGTQANAAKPGGLQAPAGPMTLGEKKPATFNHATHTALGVDCGACHHDASHKPLTAKNIATLASGAELACDKCHNANFANTKLQKRMAIFHENCRSCHEQGVNGKQGPTRCNDCHVSK